METEKQPEYLIELTALLNKLDVANLAATVASLPEDEYLNEATQILEYYYKFNANNIEAFIESVFKESFYPINVYVPVQEILDFLNTLGVNHD